MGDGIVDDSVLADLADGTLAGPEWDVWLLAHPEIAQEVALARRVRVFMADMRTMDIVVPDDFEARLLERIRNDTTMLDFLELMLNNFGHVVVDLLNMLLGLMSAPRTQPVGL